MAEILDKENSKSNARNSRMSPDRRVSSDGRQSILAHFRTSFASFDVGTKPRRCSTAGKPNSSNNGRLISLSNPQTILPLSENSNNPKRISTGDASNSRNGNEKPRLSDNLGDSRISILPHYRKSFVSCNFGGNSRVISSRKSSSSKERNNIVDPVVVPRCQTSVSRNSGERKSTSNLRGSILPHYRTPFYSCTSSAGYQKSSSAGKLQSLNNEKNGVQNHQSSERNSTEKQICSHHKEQENIPLRLRTSTGSCHDSCKNGVIEVYEEKPRVSITKRDIPFPFPNHNNRRTIAQDEMKKQSSSKQYSSDSEIHVQKSYNSNQEISNSSKKRSSSAKSRPTREDLCLSPEVSRRLSAKRNRVTNTILSEPVLSNPNLPENEIETEIPTKIIQSPSSILSTSSSPIFTSEENSEEDLSDSNKFEYEYDYTDSEYSYDDSESVTSESSDIILPEKPRRRTTSKVVHYVANEDSPPVKLKFRRGRIIEIEKDDDKNGPRKLIFKRGKVLESKEDGKSNGRIKIYRKRVDNGRIAKHKGSPKHEKVSLKHQDVEERKDLQGLLNNVIEETANKLVESRRSKVKALVGAFETVFSAADTPPGTPTTT